MKKTLSRFMFEFDLPPERPSLTTQRKKLALPSERAHAMEVHLESKERLKSESNFLNH